MKIRHITKAIQPLLNKPYSLGCHNGGIDCLGLLWTVFDNLGINLPRKYKRFNKDNYAAKWVSGETEKDLIDYIRNLGYQVSLKNIIPGDIIISKTGGLSIYLGSLKKITVIENYGVVVVPVKFFQPAAAIRISYNG